MDMAIKGYAKETDNKQSNKILKVNVLANSTQLLLPSTVAIYFLS